MNLFMRRNDLCDFYFISATESASKYEVFLGGSCNPTTWRQEVAIPILKNLGITYYNPVRHLQISLAD